MPLLPLQEAVIKSAPGWIVADQVLALHKALRRAYYRSAAAAAPAVLLLCCCCCCFMAAQGELPGADSSCIHMCNAALPRVCSLRRKQARLEAEAEAAAAGAQGSPKKSK